MRRTLFSAALAALFAGGLPTSAAVAEAPVSAEATTTIGTVTIAEPWARATPPAATAGGVFAELTNSGGTSVRLTGGSTPVAERVEIHEMTMNGDVMQMRPLADGLEVPAGGGASLSAGGYHIMLLDLTEPLVEGARFPLTLTFSDGSSGTVTVTVRSLTAGLAGGAPAGHEH